MPLTEREAFKVGFLARCVEDALGREQILQVVKTAADKMAGILGDVGKGVAGVAGFGGSLLGAAAPIALLAPPVLGGIAGAGLAGASDIDDTDVGEIKDKEVINAYRTEAQRLRRQKAVRDYAKARAASGRIFL